MMNYRTTMFLSLLLVLAACAPTRGIEIHDAWMRPTQQGENGAVYFVIHNHTPTPDEIVGAASDAAAVVEMHESIVTSGDVVQMHEVASVLLESYAEVEFAPGSFHLMLVDLAQEVKAGDEIEVTLKFRDRDDITIQVHVGEIGAPGETHEAH